jgi:hypothetical protein
MSKSGKVIVPRRNKYNARKRAGSDGFIYDSITEHDYVERLLSHWREGRIRMVLRQVPFYLPGKIKLVLDVVWIDALGEMHFEDVKSDATAKLAPFRAKKKMVEQIYDIRIDVVNLKRKTK